MQCYGATLRKHLALDAGHQLFAYVSQLLVNGNPHRLGVDHVAANTNLAGQLFSLFACCLHAIKTTLEHSDGNRFWDFVEQLLLGYAEDSCKQFPVALEA